MKFRNQGIDKNTGSVSIKKLELLLATPRATLTHLSCSPNFPRTSYLDERTLTYEQLLINSFLFKNKSNRNDEKRADLLNYFSL